MESKEGNAERLVGKPLEYSARKGGGLNAGSDLGYGKERSTLKEVEELKSIT